MNDENKKTQNKDKALDQLPNQTDIDIESLKKEIEKLTKEKEEYLKNWQTERANFLNYQGEEKERFIRYADFEKLQFLKDLLNVVDDFDIAFKTIGDYSDDSKAQQLKDGFYLIYSHLQDFLDHYGVKPIEALGQMFDPQKHEAIATSDETDKPEGYIVEEIQKGYYFKDRVLRPAKVRIVKK